MKKNNTLDVGKKLTEACNSMMQKPSYARIDLSFTREGMNER